MYMIRLLSRAGFHYRGPFETKEDAEADYADHWSEFRGQLGVIVSADDRHEARYADAIEDADELEGRP